MPDNTDEVTAPGVAASLPPSPQVPQPTPKWLGPILHSVGYLAVGLGGVYGGASTAEPAEAAAVARLEEDVVALQSDLSDELEKTRDEVTLLREAFTELRVSIASRTGVDPVKPGPGQ